MKDKTKGIWIGYFFGFITIPIIIGFELDYHVPKVWNMFWSEVKEVTEMEGFFK